LEPSPGKNYVSKKFVVINSTFFMLDWVLDRSVRRQKEGAGVLVPDFQLSVSFERAHWVGSGLLKGQARVVCDTRDTKGNRSAARIAEANVDFGQLRSQLNWILDWSEDEKEERERCLAVWYRYMRPILMAEKRSWRIPVSLGGLGLPLGGATRPQLVLANMIIKTQNPRLAARFSAHTRAKNSTTLAQLEAEKRFYDSIGARKVLKANLPYFVQKVPCEPYENEEGKLMTEEYRIVEAKTHDVSVSPYLVGLSYAELEEEESRKDFDFEYELKRAISTFNGGPALLEEALDYDGKVVWAGGFGTLPQPFIGYSPPMPADAWNNNAFDEMDVLETRAALVVAAPTAQKCTVL
jgi:hypothetical protein